MHEKYIWKSGQITTPLYRKILDCMKANRESPLPPDVNVLLRLGEVYFPYFGSLKTPYSDGSSPPKREERAILQLSKTIGDRRLQLAERVSSTTAFGKSQA